MLVVVSLWGYSPARVCGPGLQHSVSARFFEWGGQRGAKKFLGGQVYMVANSASSQRGTHTPFLTASQVPLLSLDLSFPLCFLRMAPFLSLSLSFPFSDPPLLSYRYGDLGERRAVSSPSGSGRSPAAKCNFVNSGPIRNERFLTCQSDKLQCSLNPLLCIFLDSLTALTVLVSSTCSLIVIFTEVSK